MSNKLKYITRRSSRAVNVARMTATLLLTSLFMTTVAQAGEGDPFFDSLQGLCGARFEGEMTFPESGQDAFAGKLLVAHIAECRDSEIRVPFAVGEDHSRTWIFRLTAEGLQLKHDHRHADGTPDEVTMYGGLAPGEGTSLSQSFPADAYTAELIPAAATNVWTVSLNEDASELTYYLERNAAPRFSALLKRVP